MSNQEKESPNIVITLCGERRAAHLCILFPCRRFAKIAPSLEAMGPVSDPPSRGA